MRFFVIFYILFILYLYRQFIKVENTHCFGRDVWTPADLLYQPFGPMCHASQRTGPMIFNTMGYTNLLDIIVMPTNYFLANNKIKRVGPRLEGPPNWGQPL